MMNSGGKWVVKLARVAATALVAIGFGGSALAVEKIQSVVQYNYDDNLRPKCTAVRMNSTLFGDPDLELVDACALSAQRGNGPDRITRTVYSGAGEVIQVLEGYGISTVITKPDNTTVTVPFMRAYATYSYSSNGKLLDTIDARGNKTRNRYDDFDRLVAIWYPASGLPNYDPSSVSQAKATAGAHNTSDLEAFTYDNNGNRLSWRRRDGVTIFYTYDTLNRQVLKDLPGSYPDVVTSYDAHGNITSRRFANEINGLVYSYNALGWMTSSLDQSLRPVSYVYNAAGARTEVVFPSMRKVVYQLDALNRIKRADLLNGQLLYTLAYNNQGQRRKLNRVNTISASESPNTCTTSTDATCYIYDRLGRLTSMTHDFNNPAGAVSDITWAFAYNPANQVRHSAASTDDFAYFETSVGAESPRYDGLNRSVTIAAQGGTYDVRGNLTKESSSGRVYTYDIENRLLSVANAGTPTSPYVTLNYDPEGRLRTYTNTTSATTFVYDGVNAIAEYNGNTLAMETYFGPGVDEPIIGYSGSTYRLYWANHQGSIVGITATGGTLTTGNLYKYGAYGEPRNVSNLEDWSGSRFRYTGQMALPEAKLYHYKARAYDPQMGRFLQTDPIGSEDDLNLYAYVAGDPVNTVDPTGNNGRRFIPPVRNGQPRNSAGVPALSVPRRPVLPSGELAPLVSPQQVMAVLNGQPGPTPRTTIYVDPTGRGPILQGETAGQTLVRPEGYTSVTLVGRPQVTRNSSGETNHANASLEAGLALARTGEYSHIYFNRTLATCTGGCVQSNLRPDVYGQRQVGPNHVTEILSPGQSGPARDLQLKTLMPTITFRAVEQ